MKKILFVLFSCFGVLSLFGQNDTILLDEVYLTDQYLLRYTDTQSKSILNDSVLQRNAASLTNLLNFNSLVYLKENGAGMVSSPSFRGTTASQTAVVWNGININSLFLGQTDFNTVNPYAYDNVVIKAGGGSSAYGSGAIGGSIHLNNELRFNQGFENQILANYGSFNRYGLNYKTSYSNEKLSLNFNLGRTASDNDYPFINKDGKNKNGEYSNNNLSVAAAYKFNSKNRLNFYSNFFDGKRYFSLISPNAMPSKYDDYNSRSMVEWNTRLGKFNSNLKAVYLNENYRYYPNINSVNYEHGDNDSWIAKYDLEYQHKNLLINAVADFTHSEGKGSNIDFAKRQIGSFGLQMKHQLSKQLLYEAGVRQEISDLYDSPFLYSFGIKWKPAEIYQISFNSSKNFRMPTFNDLFWPGSGNLDLEPENSLQFEVGNHLKFNDLNLTILAYHNSIENLIQWKPAGNISVPENVGEVKIYGVEALLNYNKQLGQHGVEFNTSYAYTQSENQKNKKQLIYVPFHRANASIGYSWKAISAYYQWMYNGKVFTDTNHTNELKAYDLSNLGLEYGLGKANNYKLGFQLLNLWNKDYQNVQNRPMPGRNYNIYINLKF